MKAWNKFCCALASLVLLMGSLAAPAFAYGTETAEIFSRKYWMLTDTRMY